MSAETAPGTRLVADIGGTNSRLALFDGATQALRSQRNYQNSDFPDFEAVVARWLDELAEPAPEQCCLAIAAPPFEDRVDMLNIDWSFSLQALASRFGFRSIQGINDFVGNAYALPHLGNEDLAVLRAAPGAAGTRLATMGPGTGLGGCVLTRTAGQAIACHSEPGHMGLAAANQLEIDLFRAVLGGPGEIYAEYLLSGDGLLRLYRAMAEVRGEQATATSPADVSERALARECELSVATLDTFCALLGSVCGDFVLANGAFGGLYLAGGILPRILDILAAGPFLDRLRSKGKMAAHLDKVPVYVIVTDRAGLLGAGHAPMAPANDVPDGFSAK